MENYIPIPTNTYTSTCAYSGAKIQIPNPISDKVSVKNQTQQWITVNRRHILTTNSISLKQVSVEPLTAITWSVDPEVTAIEIDLVYTAELKTVTLKKVFILCTSWRWK